MKYLRLFENHQAYEEARQILDLPNVSHCIQEAEVHYNPYIPPFFCKLKLQDGSTVEIKGSGILTSGMTNNYRTTCIGAEVGTLCTSIKNYTFWNCSGLTNVSLSNTVTGISGYAFSQCSSLTSIDMPDSVTDIGDYVFHKCSALTNVSLSNNLINIGGYAFKECNSLTSITIPDSVKRIYAQAFNKCNNLTNVVIGSGVTKIRQWAFGQNDSLTSVTITATTPPTMQNDVFTMNAPNRKIYVPSASVDTYKAATGWIDYASDIEPIQ